jgi:hypothetical protein
MMKPIGVWTLAVLAIGTASVAAHAADATTARFDKLKALAGDWTKSDGDHLMSKWQFYKDGKPGELAEFSLVRKAS